MSDTRRGGNYRYTVKELKVSARRFDRLILHTNFTSTGCEIGITNHTTPTPNVTRNRVGTASSCQLYYIKLIHRFHDARSQRATFLFLGLGHCARVATIGGLPILRCANPDGVGRIQTSDTEHRRRANIHKAVTVSPPRTGWLCFSWLAPGPSGTARSQVLHLSSDRPHFWHLCRQCDTVERLAFYLRYV